MVITERFAWGHVKKTGGDAVLKYFQLFPDLLQYADPVASPAKHLSFSERAEQVRGKQLVLNIRRLPAWVLSWAQHKSRHAIPAIGKTVPLPPADELVETREPDAELSRWTQGGRLAIDRWLRMEYLAWDFLDFISGQTAVTDTQRNAILRMGVIKQHEYDHEIGRWFTPQQIERLYANNPQWAALEKKLYPDPAGERILQQARRQEESAMAMLELAECDRKAENRLVFVLGSPRSGTTALGQAIAQHSGFYTSTESQLLVDLFAGGQLSRHFERSRRHDGCFLSREGVSPAQLNAFIGVGMAALFSHVAKGRRWVDHTPAYSMMAPNLAEMFPYAKFLHIVRDGRRVVNSMIHFLSGLPQGVQDEIRAARTVPWAIDFRQACRTWARYALAASSFCELQPARSMTVRYEAMVAEPEKIFADIYRFLEVPYEPRGVRHLRTCPGNSSFRKGAAASTAPWHDWSDEQRKTFVEEAGAAMVKLRLAKPSELAVPGVEIPHFEATGFQKAVNETLPQTAVAAVISKGDELLTYLGEHRRAWHFPCNEEGQFTGWYPAESSDAISHLEELRGRGAQYLIVPAAARWWLSHYAAFAQHLGRYRQVFGGDDVPCLIFDLRAAEAVSC